MTTTTRQGAPQFPTVSGSMLTPPCFVTHGKTARKLFPKLVAFEAAPTPLKVPGIMAAASGI